MMKNSTRQYYTKEFKLKTIKLIEAEGYSLGEVSLRLGISKSTLSKWKFIWSEL
jgi:transposase-like protein